MNRHFTWSSESREGLAACGAKGVPSFLSYFKTLSVGPGPGNRTRDLPTSNGWANTAAGSGHEYALLESTSEVWPESRW